jgi:hypothetical protein
VAHGAIEGLESRDQLLDVVLTMYGDSSYYHPTVERGWSHDEAMNWLGDVLPTILLEAAL